MGECGGNVPGGCNENVGRLKYFKRQKTIDGGMAAKFEKTESDMIIKLQTRCLN